MLDLAQHAIFRKTYSVDFKSLSLFDKMKETSEALDYLVNNGYENWVVTFSGGKDSTATLVMVLEYIKANPKKVVRIDVVYADTLVEIPTIHAFALKTLAFVRDFQQATGFNIATHVTQPEMDERYWVKILGYGYPPPHQMFRWCTKRLKIEPSEQGIQKHIVPNKTAILTGVRFGESQARDARLNDSCTRGGECGQGVWFKRSEALQVGYLAPIVNWTSCEVWDLISGFAPSWGYPVKELEKVYNDHETRFGCWMCTVIKKDKAMLKTIEQDEWAHLKPMADFRNYVWESTRNPNTRIKRKSGGVGKLRLNTRRALLKKLMLVQEKVGIQLIAQEEIDFIKNLWVK